MIKEIELVTRQFFNIQAVLHSSHSEDITAKIKKAVQESEKVLEVWDSIAQAIPSQYEPYSNELLENILVLWVSIRGHSFAQDWSMKSDSKFKKATRKTLKKKSEQ